MPRETTNAALQALSAGEWANQRQRRVDDLMEAFVAVRHAARATPTRSTTAQELLRQAMTALRGDIDDALIASNPFNANRQEAAHGS